MGSHGMHYVPAGTLITFILAGIDLGIFSFEQAKKFMNIGDESDRLIPKKT